MLDRQITIGADGVATVRVAVFDNFWSDGSRTAKLTLTRPDGSKDTATLVITDDEEAKTVRKI